MFTEAIHRIEGLAIARGKFRIALALVERGDDFEVVAKRVAP